MSAMPLATRDAWSYGGDFYVEASGHNRHRRATVPELKAHFDGSSTDGPKDRPAHWYEAQLLHYGLPPSKTKGTAKMRLFEAVQKGNLSVPANIVKVESDLKKEWAKKEREAKQTLKKQVEAISTSSARGTKRKADTPPAVQGTSFNLNLSFSVGPQGNLQISPAGPSPAPSKKARATKTTPDTPAKAPKAAPKAVPPKETKPAKATPKAASAKPAPSKETKVTKTAAAAAKKSTPSSFATPDDSPPPRTKQTVRRGVPFSRGGARGGSSRPVSGPEPTSSPVNRAQTARRSNPSGLAGRGMQTARRGGGASSLAIYDNGSDDPPPPYTPYPGSSSQVTDAGVSEISLRPLGLLNGRYTVRCLAPQSAVDIHKDSGLIFTLDGNALWGSFEIGPVAGMLRLEERPRMSSLEWVNFDWRPDDHIRAETGLSSDSFIRFLGGGKVEGEFTSLSERHRFEGQRISGQETRSEISAFEMREHWDSLA